MSTNDPSAQDANQFAHREGNVPDGSHPEPEQATAPYPNAPAPGEGTRWDGSASGSGSQSGPSVPGAGAGAYSAPGAGAGAGLPSAYSAPGTGAGAGLPSAYSAPGAGTGVGAGTGAPSAYSAPSTEAYPGVYGGSPYSGQSGMYPEPRPSLYRPDAFSGGSSSYSSPSIDDATREHAAAGGYAQSGAYPNNPGAHPGHGGAYPEFSSDGPTYPGGPYAGGNGYVMYGPWTQGPYGGPFAPTHPVGKTKKRRLSLALASILAIIGLLLAGTGIGYALGRGNSSSNSTQGQVPGQYDDGYSWNQGGNSSDPFMPVPIPEDNPGRNSTGSTPVDRGTEVTTPGVVLINTTELTGLAAGTGSILTSDGQVLTNYHVVQGSTKVYVTDPSSGSRYEATVVGHDETHDVALLQLENAKDLQTVTLADSGVSVGDTVHAVGNGGGQGYLTQLEGEVTAVDQTVRVSNENESTTNTMTGMIETSADIISGYSGGPLFNSDGEQVGINSAGNLGPTHESAYGWAIPINDAMKIVKQIRSGKSTDTVQVGPNAALGVTITPSSNGALIQAIADGSGAEKAGLQVGDVITAVDGNALQSTGEVSRYIRSLKVGDTVDVSIIRPDSSAGGGNGQGQGGGTGQSQGGLQGTTQDIKVTLGESTVN